MRNYLAILKKELYSLFVSPIAYAVLAVFFAVSGFFFSAILKAYIDRAFQLMMQSQQFGSAPPPLDVPTLVMSNFFAVVSTILLFLLPMVTMGIFAEERKRGTIELLFTSPITHTQLILGKFSAALLFLALMLAPTILNSILLIFYSEPALPLPPILAGYLGAFLFGGALLAIGVFVSSLTENQIVAAVVTFGIVIILLVIEAGAGTGSTLSNEVIRYLSVINHYEDFTRGIIDTQHVVFYVSFITLGLFLTSLSLDSVKWRQ